ncbi:MAG TPA: YkgJ family cysteine cluster protein [Candidatus Korarchaeota archaeon]|nr:YkgJ family cysteine cluster protein [Candidatus Korarchaeota archaeon]
MILAEEDVKKIVALGYKLEEFSEFRRGYLRLRNRGGRCFFLDEKGACIIYDRRPLGCRAYPVVYDVEGMKCKVDEDCPAGNTLEQDEFLEKCSIVLRALPQLIKEDRW